MTMTVRDVKDGFTIAELLVVVVVLGILVTATVVAYRNIRGLAVDASLKTDAENATKVLANDLTITGSYPASVNVANNGKGLPFSSGNSYGYVVNNGVTPPTYILTVSNTASANSYQVTSTNNVPVLVTSTPPVITLQPASWIGYSNTFTTTATGSPTPTIQWQKSTDNVSWTNIVGATNPNLTTSDSVPCAQTFFRAVYTNTAGSTTTSSAYLEGPGEC